MGEIFTNGAIRRAPDIRTLAHARRAACPIGRWKWPPQRPDKSQLSARTPEVARSPDGQKNAVTCADHFGGGIAIGVHGIRDPPIAVRNGLGKAGFAR